MPPRTPKLPEEGDDAWPIIGDDGVWELIRRRGGNLGRTYVPKIMDRLPPARRAGRTKWWFEGELVPALREQGWIE